MHVAFNRQHEALPNNMYRILGPVALWKRVGLSSERSRDLFMGLAFVLCVSPVVVPHTTTPGVEYSGEEARNLKGGACSRAGLVEV